MIIVKNRNVRTTMFLVLTSVVLVAVGIGWLMSKPDDSGTVDTANVPNDERNNASQSEMGVTLHPTEMPGVFTGVAPKSGSGSMTLVQTEGGVSTVQFEEDFKVQDGPALYVGFGNEGVVDQNTLFTPLNAIEGAQEYQVPGTINVSKYSQVFIYCKEFSTVFAVATFR